MKMNDLILVGVITVTGIAVGATILWRSTWRAIDRACSGWSDNK